MTKRERDKALKAAYIEAARALPGCDAEFVIDDDAKVSVGDDPGAYVQAWIWVNEAGMKTCLQDVPVAVTE